jgi:primary-amine oxidase
LFIMFNLAWVIGMLGAVSVAQAKELLPGTQGGCEQQTVSFSAGSAWKLCVTAVQKYGLIIASAEFRRSASSPFIKVLHDGRLGEIFVPYHEGQPRYRDIAEFNFPTLTLSAADCPRPRAIIGNDMICKEFGDYGLAWKDDALVRRGEAVSYWAVLDADNYNYVMEWSFRDDGVISSRIGSTGPMLDAPGGTMGHMHIFTWRLDIDLNGAGDDSAHFTKHEENLRVSPSTGTDSINRVSKEGGLGWNPLAFNTLEVSDGRLVNGRGRRTSYKLFPLVSGSVRHTEAFTKKDFWVTTQKDSEILAQNLSNYVSDGQSTVNQDIVIWYTTGVHHEENMRDEDYDTVPVIWAGLTLVPKNLFDGTPFYRR